jgi:enterochelin esterase-like enzyme
MRFKPTLIILFALLSANISAQSGKVFDNLTLTSKILESEQNYAIYLPPGYNTSERSYPVLYLLHGLGDDHTGWIQFGEVRHITDKAINEGKATPMIIVMPDGNNDVIGYYNTADGAWRYEDYFFEEFLPHVEDKYRIKSEKRFRAIAGLSMGGGGSFIYALHRPDLFSSACPLSAYVGPDKLKDLELFKHPNPDSLTEKEKSDYIDKYHAVKLIENLPKEEIASVRWYIDCGDDDFLSIPNCEVHIAMSKRNIQHEYRVRQGHHSWTYWRESLPEVLKFVSDAFHQY